MNEGEMLFIKVPASTANLGPGFDSIGLALNLYLTLEVVRSDCWEVIPLTDELKEFPQDERNFIVKTAIEVAESFQTILSPCEIKVASNIPLARGLGSSASAIVAGIELADQVGDLRLTKQEKFEIASKMEGHPDNVGASLFGGLVIGCQLGEEVDAETIHSIDLEVLAVIPEEELLTKSSRGVLPSTLSFGEAVSAGAISNLLVAALLSGNLELAGKMMKKDKYHQPYRKELVPHLQILEEQAYELGAYGVALSGAGPTVLCFVRPGEMNALIEGLTPLLPEMCFLPLEIDKEGSLCTGAIVTDA
ncbi:homoserine kinase [Niallia sp. Sow4_A1]|jgi:homoserine kinase|uniref:Homoserine kinase n=1 Tax=Niallia hominis TaxID=3133173 RepID=A0ABV1F182_9BACI|nr:MULTISPECIES: homoserine kinase [Bacillaceae]MCF2646979.1 homoserine kinase [Niallia circulans]MCM3361936.1 homoserine kinase [Niallia sp. MER TA 168]CAI9392667.1 Homoserine kinase [Bacillus sp. T2.9-1]